MSFNEEANCWDTTARKERATILAEKIHKKLSGKIGMQAMEIGCGTGLISMNLRDELGVIHCVDESSGMIKVLQSKIDKCNIGNIYVHELDFLQDDTYYKKFDVIYSSMVFHHIDKIEEELCLLTKFLKEDGIIIIIDLDKEDGTFHKNEKDFHGHNGLDRLWLTAMCKSVGLSDVKFETAYEDDKMIDNLPIKYTLFMCVARRGED